MEPKALDNPFLPSVVDRVESGQRPDPSDPDGLSTKERAVVTGVIQGLTPDQSATSAGYVGHGSGPEVLSRPQVRSALIATLDRLGLGDEIIGKKIKEGLEATYPIAFRGELVQELPDHSARHKYLSTLIDLREGGANNEGDGDSWEEVVFRRRARRLGCDR